MPTAVISHRRAEPETVRDDWLKPRRLTARPKGAAACGGLKPFFVNRKNSAIAYRNFTPDFLDHGGPYSETTGREVTKRMMDGMYAQYPDLSVTIEDIFAEGDKVVVRNIWRGTDATTGKRMSFEGIVIWRFANGRLAERWAKIEPPREDAL